VTYAPTHIDFYENATGGFELIHEIMKINAGSRIIASVIRGPLYLNRNTQVGPDADIGAWFGYERELLRRARQSRAILRDRRANRDKPLQSSDQLAQHQRVPISSQVIRLGQRVPGLRATRAHARHVRAGLRRQRRLDRPQCLHHAGRERWRWSDRRRGRGGFPATVPPFAIVAGVPATIKRLRLSEKTIERLLRVRWWDLELRELSGLPFRDVERCLDTLEERRSR